MFGANNTAAELDQQIHDYRAALQQIAQHVGVDGMDLSPAHLAIAICNAIDVHVEKGSQKTRVPGSESRAVPVRIRKIILAGAVNVLVRHGTEPKMEVFADSAADLPKVLTTVAGDCLTVDNEPMAVVSGNASVTRVVAIGRNAQAAGRDILNVAPGNGHVMERSTGPVGCRVEITLPKVTSLQLSGAGDMTYLDVSQDALSLEVSGAGSIELTGQVNRIEAAVSGAGDIVASRLSSAHGRLHVSGAGNIKATVTESVVARVSGIGKIKIGGEPPQRDTDVSGVGKIKFLAARS